MNVGVFKGCVKYTSLLGGPKVKFKDPKSTLPKNSG